MKPNAYYRRPDRLVGLTDPKGRFSHAASNQLTAETEFHRQRLNEAARQVNTGGLSATALMQAADHWRVAPGRLLQLIRKGA